MCTYRIEWWYNCFVFVLQRCTRDIQTKNTLPPSTSLVCEWDKCSKTFTNYQSYLNHVQTHTGDVPRGKKVVGGVNCKWMGCNGNYATIYKLRDHIRCHTKEKAIACPDCGQMFASTTKFIDHCKRQIPIEGMYRVCCLYYFFHSRTSAIKSIKFVAISFTQFKDSSAPTATSFIQPRTFCESTWGVTYFATSASTATWRPSRQRAWQRT